MTFDFTNPGSVSIGMDKFVDDLLSASQVTGSADTPASDNLFKTRDAPKLSPALREEFHSVVAKLLYLAKRARPDLLTVVSFLTRRTLAPDTDDYKKLNRALRYLNATRHLKLIFEPGPVPTIQAYVDASYAVHEDFKSHTGMSISLGGGATHAKSSVQKLNVKSSTEAELVALSDSSSWIIWTRDYLEAQGYAMPPAKVYQDNMSTQAMVKRGHSSSEKTRHINVRYFFVKDRVDTGEIIIEHLPTDCMLADLLTKPLQSEQFKALRDRILGHTRTAGNALIIFATL